MISDAQTEQARRVESGVAGTRLILASGSPRRHALLGALGATFSVVVTDAETSDEPAPAVIMAALPPAAVPPGSHPTLLAWRKAQAAAEAADEAVVLGADTIVVVDDKVLNKPVDAAEARAMLRQLSGRAHTVFTGLCVLRAGAAEPAAEAGPDALGSAVSLWHAATQHWLAVVAAEVEFNALDDAEIAAYVATGEPLDKAGAYGLQGRGGRLVREVRGSYTTVVGFPLVMVHQLLTTAGITGLADPTATYRRWLQSQGKEPLPWPPTLP